MCGTSLVSPHSIWKLAKQYDLLLQGTVQHQLLALTESLVVIGQAASGMLGHAAWSYGSLQGVLLFTLAAHKLTHSLRHVLVQSLEQIPLPC